MIKNIYGRTCLEAFKKLNAHIIASPEYLLDSRIGKTYECTSIVTTIEDPSNYVFDDPNINRIDYGYAETFYDFMMSGGTDAEEAFAEYPSVAKFVSKPKSDELPDNFNTFYGPRIVAQLPAIIKELTEHPESRRAVLQILNESDHALLDKDELLEYPCTDSMTYFIRDDKLHGHVHMRSQNTAVVLQLDMYLQARVLEHIANILQIPVGPLSISMVSGHVYERDLDYVRGFIGE